MQFKDLDRDPETGEMPISRALLWLHTLVNSPAVNWNAGQREEALRALDGARVAMTTQVTVVQKQGGGFALEFVKVRPAAPQAPRPNLVIVPGGRAD